MDSRYGPHEDSRKPDGWRWYVIFDCWLTDRYGMPFIATCTDPERIKVDNERIFGPFNSVLDGNRAGEFLMRTQAPHIARVLQAQRCNLEDMILANALKHRSLN